MSLRKPFYGLALFDCDKWKDIDGYEEYQVHPKGYVRNKIYRNVLRGGKTKQGYLTVSLHKNKKGKTFTIHSLVLKTFVPNPLNKRCINHINGIKNNNYISNLEWNTHKENNQHAYINGLRKPKIAKGVIQMDMCGNEIARYHSSEVPGFRSGCICLVASGKRLSHAGFKWAYIN